MLLKSKKLYHILLGTTIYIYMDANMTQPFNFGMRTFIVIKRRGSRLTRI